MDCKCKCHTETTYNRDHNVWLCPSWCYGIVFQEKVEEKGSK